MQYIIIGLYMLLYAYNTAYCYIYYVIIYVYIGGDERDGYLLSYLFNGRDQTSSLVIFDASDINKGPVYTLPISIYLPHYQHASYAPGIQ